MIKTIGAAGAAVLAPSWLAAQTAAEPPSTVSNPPRDFSPGAAPVTYPDPDLVTVDPAFNGLRIGNTPIQRLWTGALWSEGPAWSSQGRYLVWSDIPNDRQLRWLEDDGRVTVFRAPSNNSNGNTFDFAGPASFVRAPAAPRRALRARRQRRRARRRLRRQAAELAERRRAAPRRQLLVHGPAVRRPALRRRARCARRAEQRARRCCANASVKPQASATRSASCRPTSIASRRTAASTIAIAADLLAGPAERPRVLGRLQEALRRQRRQPARRRRRRRRPRVGRQAVPRSRRSTE